MCLAYRLEICLAYRFTNASRGRKFRRFRYLILTRTFWHKVRVKFTDHFFQGGSEHEKCKIFTEALAAKASVKFYDVWCAPFCVLGSIILTEAFAARASVKFYDVWCAPLCVLGSIILTEAFAARASVKLNDVWCARGKEPQ